MATAKHGYSWYFIVLVVFIIVVSEHFTRFAKFFTGAGKNPVATLATLVLVSYTKLIGTTTLSFATRNHPDGSPEIVWLLDANVHYFSTKHSLLLATVLVIFVLDLLYRIVLFSWQWLLQYSGNQKVLFWMRNTKVCCFMETYQDPYLNKTRYWTGLLLLTQTALYLVAALNVFGNPNLSILVVVGCILLLKLQKKNMI